MKFCHLLILLLLIPVALQAQQKSNQISLRLGEPLGVGYRRLIGERHAFELNVGTASGRTNGRYYRNSFYSYNDLDDYDYIDHTTTDILYLGARYVWRKPIQWDAAPGKFEWYLGAGLLFKKATVVYAYEKPGPEPVFGAEKKTDIDIGPEGVIGIEYTLREVPLTIYVEAGPFLELANRVAIFRGFIASGLRVNF